MPVPHDLAESVKRATRAGDRALLGLLAWEVAAFGGEWRDTVHAEISEALSALGPAGSWRRAVLFTGHRLDAPDRPTPRFPASAEDAARRMIHDAVRRHVSDAAASLGVAGGASGGDILFHEVCEELGVESHLLLVGPADAYVQASVADAGDDWVKRFHTVERSRPTTTLQDSLELPRWLRDRDDYSVWQRNNVWTLCYTLASTPNATVLALWNGQAGDGPGGTADMIALARARGAEVDVLDARKLLPA